MISHVQMPKPYYMISLRCTGLHRLDLFVKSDSRMRLYQQADVNSISPAAKQSRGLDQR